MAHKVAAVTSSPPKMSNPSKCAIKEITAGKRLVTTEFQSNPMQVCPVLRTASIAAYSDLGHGNIT